MLQNFTVKKNDGTTDVVYYLQSNQGASATYMDTTSGLVNPRIVKITNVNKPAGQIGSDRHTVLAQSVVLDSSNLPHTVSASLTWTIPRTSAVSETVMKDCLAACLNYLALSGVKDALIDGILP